LILKLRIENGIAAKRIRQPANIRPPAARAIFVAKSATGREIIAIARVASVAIKQSTAGLARYRKSK